MHAIQNRRSFMWWFYHGSSTYIFYVLVLKEMVLTHGKLVKNMDHISDLGVFRTIQNNKKSNFNKGNLRKSLLR